MSVREILRLPSGPAGRNVSSSDEAPHSSLSSLNQCRGCLPCLGDLVKAQLPAGFECNRGRLALGLVSATWYCARSPFKFYPSVDPFGLEGICAVPPCLPYLLLLVVAPCE